MPPQDLPSEIHFDQGVPVTQIPDGKSLSGLLGDKPVLLIHQEGEFFAIDAHCSHYGGELAQGLIVGDTVRCPRHHACFSLRTGEALRAPALDPVGCWKVEQVGEAVFIREKIAQGRPKQAAAPPGIVIIVGGGGAGLAAADMLRREGFEGRLIMISSDKDAPCDRPNLSKDYLAGTAIDDWMPLRPGTYYSDNRIELLLNITVSSIDAKKKQIHLSDGQTFAFDALLLATGAEPVRLQVEGAADSQIHHLRSYADSRAIIANASMARNVVVVGASFIGLEVAASLRERGIGVHLVAPGREPLERVLGELVGAAIRKLHESHGVQFHLRTTVTRMNETQVILSDGTVLEADFLVAGIGVRPIIALAEEAGLAIDRGVTVDSYLETSTPGIFAAGDIARWPDPLSGERIRVEHWVVAERQGQTAAKNILGQKIRFDAVPFFWSQHYDTTINYVGHAEKWNSVEIDGNLEAFDCTVRYLFEDRIVATATISREMQSLQAEVSMEADIAAD
jgi:NADPH-dependent 2,4-dienoyl-CoA reductase/sulfur reductase-like enzyme/nitrite reductase/ring-hydroxylating ferredoxin subunit